MEGLSGEKRTLGQPQSVNFSKEHCQNTYALAFDYHISSNMNLNSNKNQAWNNGGRVDMNNYRSVPDTAQRGEKKKFR